MSQNLLSAAVVIGALRVKTCVEFNFLFSFHTKIAIFLLYI